MSYDGKMDDIRDTVRSMALSKVKSFYPESIQKLVNLPLDEIVEKLEVLRNEESLKLVLEVRCPNDFTVVKSIEVGELEQEKGRMEECYKCGQNFEVSLHHIYPKYLISEEFADYLKKNKQLSVERIVTI